MCHLHIHPDLLAATFIADLFTVRICFVLFKILSSLNMDTNQAEGPLHTFFFGCTESDPFMVHPALFTVLPYHPKICRIANKTLQVCKCVKKSKLVDYRIERQLIWWQTSLLRYSYGSCPSAFLKSPQLPPQHKYQACRTTTRHRWHLCNQILC